MHMCIYQACGERLYVLRTVALRK